MVWATLLCCWGLKTQGDTGVFVSQLWIILKPESCGYPPQTDTRGLFWLSHPRCLFHFPLLSYATIYRELERTILAANTQEDLKWFSNNHGPGMHMNWPAFEVQTSNLQGEAGKVRISWPISLSLPPHPPRNTTQTRPTLPQRRRSQTEPRPLRAPTMWLHLVIAAGQFKGCNEIKEFLDSRLQFLTVFPPPFSTLF